MDMSKYKKKILEILDKDIIKSTNEILRELEQATKKRINWHHLHRILTDLENDGAVQKLKAKAGFFWKKK